MARKTRIHFPEALYHLIVRGNARQDIFFGDTDRCRFLLLLQEEVERLDYRVHAFCTAYLVGEKVEVHKTKKAVSPL